MIVQRFVGGMGNQMFQYAFYKSAKERGLDIKADLSFYNKKNDNRPWQLTVFPNINVEVAEKSDMHPIYKNMNIIDRIFRKDKIVDRELEEEYGGYFERFYDKDNTVIEGYFQNINYFSCIENKLRKDFQFPKLEDKLQNIIDDIENKGNVVSVHIRRGDYMKFPHIYGGICTEEYYSEALKKLQEKVDDFQVCFFSDDMDWVKQNFQIENAMFINEKMFDNPKDWYDMCIMSHCKYNIIANSSFSWWGAWLNNHDDKLVIMPKKWDNQRKTTQLQWDGWLTIEV